MRAAWMLLIVAAAGCRKNVDLVVEVRAFVPTPLVVKVAATVSEEASQGDDHCQTN